MTFHQSDIEHAVTVVTAFFDKGSYISNKQFVYMNTELSTNITLFAAQNAGCDGTALLYGMMAPGAVAAILIVAFLLVIGLLSWVFEAITDHDNYHVP